MPQFFASRWTRLVTSRKSFAIIADDGQRDPCQLSTIFGNSVSNGSG